MGWGGEGGGGGVVVAGHVHAAMRAGIEEHVDLSRPVTAQDHRFVAHRRYEEIAGVRDLALMPDKEPRAGEHPLQFLAVNLVVDKDLATDVPRRRIHETLAIPRCPFARHRRLLGSAASRVLRLIAGHVRGRCTELRAGHGLHNPRSDPEAILPPATRLVTT